MSREVYKLAREVAHASSPDEARFPSFERAEPFPVTDYAPATQVEKYRVLAAACDAADCQFAVVPGAKPRPSAPGRCDGWRGTVIHEAVGPVLRVRPCDRAMRFRQHERETRPTKSGKSAPKSWTDGGQ